MKYSIVLQNTLDKSIHIFNVDDSNDSPLYYNFEIDSTNLPEGEYYLVLVENPDWKPIKVQENNIFGKDNVIYFIVNKGDFIKNGSFFIINGKDEFTKLEPIALELLRVGDYNTADYILNKYDNNEHFVQYIN